MNADFLDRLLTEPAGVIVNGAIWDPVTRELQVSVKSTFSQSVNNDFRLACALTEDGVTGTDAGYNQSNAYAGGGNGVMGVMSPFRVLFLRLKWSMTTWLVQLLQALMVPPYFSLQMLMLEKVS